MNQDSAALLNAVRGPVIMITIGVLFALDNFTPFSFNRTWPILLVVVGILSLGKGNRAIHGRARFQAKWGPPTPPAWGPPRPPMPPPPPPHPSETSTKPPGSYRGSPYEATPGGSTPRGSENREKHAYHPSDRPAGNATDTGATP